MLHKLAAVLLAVLAMIASGHNACAQPNKATQSQVRHVKKAPGVPAARSAVSTRTQKRRAKGPARSGASRALKARKAVTFRGKVAARAAKPARSGASRALKARKAVTFRGRAAARTAKPTRSGASRALKGRQVVTFRGRAAARVAPPPRRSATKPRQVRQPPGRRTTGRYAVRPKPRPAMPSRPAAVSERAPRTLSFFNLHTRESITVTYRRNGAYVPAALDRLDRFLRDSRDALQVRMDPALFDVLWLVRHRLRSRAAYHVVSGYRSPETNAWLASYSSGVASNSLHMRGQAMDVRLPGRSAAQLRAAGVELGMGGVGYYPRSGFVHLDTGPVRYW